MIIIATAKEDSTETNFEFEYQVQGAEMNWIDQFYHDEFQDPENDAYEIMVLLLGTAAIVLYFCLVYLVVGIYRLFCRESKFA